MIVEAGVGTANIDLLYARTCGIQLVNIPNYGSEDVAYTAMGRKLSLMRSSHLLNSRFRSRLGGWSYTQVEPLTRLRNYPIGIMGFRTHWYGHGFTSGDLTSIAGDGKGSQLLLSFNSINQSSDECLYS